MYQYQIPKHQAIDLLSQQDLVNLLELPVIGFLLEFKIFDFILFFAVKKSNFTEN